MNIGEYIKNLRTVKGLSQEELGKMVGVQRAAVQKWESGATQNLKRTTIKKLSEIFNVSPASFVDEPSNIIDVSVVYYNVIGTVAAGYGQVAVEMMTDEVCPIPIEFLKGRSKDDFFVLKVKGDSMYPKLLNGDLVFVERMSSVDSGETAVVLYNGDEATVKKVKYNIDSDYVDLIPYNPEYQTKRIQDKDLEMCRILGKVVTLIRNM